MSETLEAEKNGNGSVDGALASLLPSKDNLLEKVRGMLVEKRRERDRLDNDIARLERAESQLEELFTLSQPRSRGPREKKPDLMQAETEVAHTAFRFLVTQGLNKRVRSIELNAEMKLARKVRWTNVFAPLIRSGHVAAFGKGPGQSFCAMKANLG